MILVTVGLLAAVWASIYVYCWIRFRWARSIPGAEPRVRFFGNGLQFAHKNSYEICKSLTRVYQNKHRLFKLQFGPIPVLCPNHPDLIQKVLTDSATLGKPFVYQFMRLDHGLTTGKYERWKSHRKVLNPTFNIRILNSFIPIFTDCAAKMVQSMKEQNVPGKALNAVKFTYPCTLGMICRTSLGSKVLEQEGTQQFIKGLECIFHTIGLRMFNADLYPEFVYRHTRFYRSEMKARECCYAFTDKIIREKQEEFAKLKQQADDNNNVCETAPTDEDSLIACKKPQIFIDQLLTIPLPDGKPFSYKEIRDHIYTMIAAGNETSAIQAAHTILLLAMHQEVQEKVVAELREVFPTPETEYSPEVLKQLGYLERVMKESLRLCPVGAVFGRKTLSDIKLDEYVVPKGNFFIMNIAALHRKKEFWGEDADQFDPDRFLPENSRNRHPFAFIPFSGGSRDCIGNRYAMMSLKPLLAELLRNFKLTTDIKFEEMEFKFRLSMHLAFDHRIFLEPRNFYG